MARLYANENFPLPVVAELRRLGHDAVTVTDTGKAGQRTSDEEVLEFGTAHARAILTFNRKHFFRLHRQRSDHSGIIACTFDPDFLALAARIHHALLASTDLTGQILRINRPTS